MSKKDPLAIAQKAFDQAEKKLIQVKHLLESFPDLEIQTDRWDRERYSSAKVNSLADHVDMRHNCGCCADSPLEARPYIRFEDDQLIFSNPDFFFVGEKNVSHGFDDPTEGWEAHMRAAGISEAAIVLVHEYFKSQIEARRSELQSALDCLEDS